MESRTVRRLTTGLLVVASLIMALMPTLEPETARAELGAAASGGQVRPGDGLPVGLAFRGRTVAFETGLGTPMRGLGSCPAATSL